MYSRIVGGMLIASGEESVTLIAVPGNVPAPVQIFVPGCRTTPERPGSIVKAIVDGASPLACWYTTAAVPGFTTLNVSRPLPRLLILRTPAAIPRLQSSFARKTCVVSGEIIGYSNS